MTIDDEQSTKQQPKYSANQLPAVVVVIAVAAAVAVAVHSGLDAN